MAGGHGRRPDTRSRTECWSWVSPLPADPARLLRRLAACGGHSQPVTADRCRSRWHFWVGHAGLHLAFDTGPAQPSYGARRAYFGGVDHDRLTDRRRRRGHRSQLRPGRGHPARGGRRCPLAGQSGRSCRETTIVTKPGGAEQAERASKPGNSPDPCYLPVVGDPARIESSAAGGQTGGTRARRRTLSQDRGGTPGRKALA